MTRIDEAVDGEPSADVDPSSVLTTLLQGGRWDDAATYYPNVDNPAPVEQAQLLIAAGRSQQAHALLTDSADATHENTVWVEFVRQVDAVTRGSAQRFPDLVSAAVALPPYPVVHMLMLRAADAAGRSEAGAHYAKLLQERLPGDVDAARAVAVELVRGGDYLAAVRAIDRAELTRCIDEADPLTATLDQLTATGARASVRALATIGHFVHRELDPTQPVSDAERAARQRWRAAYHAAADRRWRQHGLHMVLFAAGIGASIAVGNALPVVLIGLALAGWARARPLPGLDLRTSQLVRAIADPLQILKSRRYRVIDVFTFIFTLVIAGGLAARLPPRPTWLDSVEVVAVFVIAIAATRGRRRWVRHERQRLQPLSLDPNTCCCLDAAALHGAHARDYVTNHLFQVGTAPGAPKWQVLQCLDTHARFLDIPAAKLALRLPLMPPRSGAPVEEP